jgi:uncharacterized protein (TIGR02231 family)
MDTTLITAPVVEATLLEDRAQVVRRGSAALAAGVSILALDGVAPVLADKTVAVRVAGARVVDVRVERETLVRSADPRRDDAALRERLHQAGLAVARLDAERAIVQRERDLLASSADHATGEINHEVAAGRGDAQAWTAAAAQLAERQLAVGLRLVDLDQRHTEAERTMGDLHRQLSAGGAGEQVARLLITVDAAAAASGAEVHVTYVVPGACWRPWHTARLDAAAVAFACEACVWQRTGEDWTAVRLRLSTDRPSLGVEPPRLVDDLLTLQPKDRAVVVEARDQAVETTGGAGGRPAAEMPGIDDGGEVRVLDVQGPATVPGDGLPHRFPLFAFTAPVQPELVVFAELAPVAILKTSQANAAAQPLLAGPVDLIRNGGLVGRASILYVAPGARFDLGWGPDAAVRVHRQEWSQEEKAGVMSSWQPTLTCVDLAFSNLAGEPRTLTVVERVPVSEVQQVKIELDAATAPAAKPDAEGLCRWTVTLAPRGQAEVKLRWRLLKQGTVVGV